MASHIYECTIDSVVRGHYVYNTIWNPFVGGHVAVTTCNSNKNRSVYSRVAFITVVVACIAATNQGRLLFMVLRLTK